MQALDFASQSLSADLGVAYPVIRSRDKNLTLSGLVFLSNNEGDLLSAANSDDRLRGVRIKADADAVDATGATDQANVTLSHGFEGFGSTENGNPLASRVNGQVDFTTVGRHRQSPATSRPGLFGAAGGNGGSMRSRRCCRRKNAAMAASSSAAPSIRPKTPATIAGR